MTLIDASAGVATIGCVFGVTLAVALMLGFATDSNAVSGIFDAWPVWESLCCPRIVCLLNMAMIVAPRDSPHEVDDGICVGSQTSRAGPFGMSYVMFEQI